MANNPIKPRIAEKLALLYADVRFATGKAKASLNAEIDEIERQLESEGLAYDRKTRRIVPLADEDEEEDIDAYL